MKKILLVISCVLASITIQAQTLFGTTFSGGKNGWGTINKFIPSTNDLTVVKYFDNTNGANPGGLVQASDGKLYGMTTFGGGGFYGESWGVIFSFDPSTTTYAKLMDLAAYPYGSLLQAKDGKLYGMTSEGGSCSCFAGTIFSFDPSNSSYTILESFYGGDEDGSNPYGSLIQARNGKFYGMAGNTIFTFDPSFNFFIDKHVVKYFDSPDGVSLYGSLIQVSDGKLYGMTAGGGDSGFGVIFSYDLSSSVYTKLKDFDGSNGAHPYGSLIQASDGKLYGLTANGGINDAGVIFSFDISSSVYTKLKDFDIPNGANPLGTLMQAKGGKLYGMTSKGGSNDLGVIFSFDPPTNTYIKLQDYNGANGANPGIGSAFIEVKECNTKTTYYQDADNDGYGKISNSTQACIAPNGYVNNHTDCDDTKASIHPGAEEVINGIDDNCDGFVDEGFRTNGNAIQIDSNEFQLARPGNGPGSTWYIKKLDLLYDFTINTQVFLGDKDSDGADGIAFVLQRLNDSIMGEGGGGIGYLGLTPSLAVEFDTYANSEINDPQDDHLAFMKNGDIEHNSNNNPESPYTLVNIEDGKWHDATFFWKAATHTLIVNFLSNSYTYTEDIIKNIFGGSPYVYWGFTGAVGYYGNDERVRIGKTSFHLAPIDDCEGGAKTTFYPDADGDGYGDPANSTVDCSEPSGYVANHTDCDDTKASVHPGATEICNGIDDDCDGLVDEGFTNTDGDGLANCVDPDDDNDGIPDYKDCAPLDKKNDKVLICHKGHTICVSRHAVPAHVKHGDKEGPCRSNPIRSASRNTVVTNDLDVSKSNLIAPAAYRISSYPNPFVETSTIKYELPADSKVSIKVYDVMGRTVATLVDDDKKAGTYTVDFKAGHLNRGSLFYRIIARSKDQQFVQTNKMIQLQ